MLAQLLHLHEGGCLDRISVQNYSSSTFSSRCTTLVSVLVLVNIGDLSIGEIGLNISVSGVISNYLTIKPYSCPYSGSHAVDGNVW